MKETLSSKTVIAIIIVVIILLPFGYSAVRAVFAQPAQSSELFLEKAVVDDAQGDKSRCVLEAQFGIDARYEHMDFLKKTRDEAMRAGIRGDVGIKSCQQCHKKTLFEYVRDAVRGGGWMLYRCTECQHQRSVEGRR